MAQERTDLVSGFRRKNVFEFASLLFDFSLAVHGEAIGEQALREAVAANDVGGALTAPGRKFDNHAAVAG